MQCRLVAGETPTAGVVSALKWGLSRMHSAIWRSVFIASCTFGGVSFFCDRGVLELSTRGRSAFLQTQAQRLLKHGFQYLFFIEEESCAF
jgi:hypothetical protein